MKKLFISSVLLLTIIIFSCTRTENSNNNVVEQSDTNETISISNNQKQEEETPPLLDSAIFQFGSLLPGSLTTVITDSYLMDDSLLTKKTEMLVHPGDTVFINFIAPNSLNSQDWTEDIYNITVINDGKKTSGFLPLDKLATTWKKLSDNTWFLFGYIGTRKNSNDASVLYGRAMIMDATFKKIDFKEFQVIGIMEGEENKPRYYYSLGVTIRPSMGLSNVINVIDLDMFYDACGYTNGDILLLWDGNKLHYGIEVNSMGEAGIVSNYEYAVYPTDANGKKDKILTIFNHREYDEDKNTETLHDSIVVQYAWAPDKGVVLEDTLFKNQPSEKIK